MEFDLVLTQKFKSELLKENRPIQLGNNVYPCRMQLTPYFHSEEDDTVGFVIEVAAPDGAKPVADGGAFDLTGQGHAWLHFENEQFEIERVGGRIRVNGGELQTIKINQPIIDKETTMTVVIK